jgi:hypothetical protein
MMNGVRTMDPLQQRAMEVNARVHIARLEAIKAIENWAMTAAAFNRHLDATFLEVLVEAKICSRDVAVFSKPPEAPRVGA